VTELQAALQHVSGTTLDAQGAANMWAGTTGLDLLGALNARNGTRGVGYLKVLNSVAGLDGTRGEGACAAAIAAL